MRRVMPKKITRLSPYQQLQADLETSHSVNVGLRNSLCAVQRELAETRKVVQSRIDTSQLTERKQIAESLSKLTFAIADAIRYVIGKEAL